jgi:HKD family nuclease
MATIEILGHARAMGDRLVGDVQEAQRLSIAVAFAKESALASIDLKKWAGPNRELRLVAGTDFTITELGLLRTIEALPRASVRFFPVLPGTTFHPKLYVIDKPGRRVAYVGSSNFTRGGLYANVEANVRIEGDPSEPELQRPAQLFDQYFSSEIAMVLSVEFEARYKELQEERRQALARYPDASTENRLRAAEGLLIGQYRGKVAERRHMIVVTPKNYDLCMKSLTCGRKTEERINRFAAGDVFFFHVTDGPGVRAMGMFTGPSYYDDADTWKNMDQGAYPWRRRFILLGELRTGLPTRAILEPLRPGAPKNWFQGYIVASHILTLDDFEALRAAFEQALREERGLGMLDAGRPVTYPRRPGAARKKRK